MIKKFLLTISLTAMLFGQSSYDILNLPTDARGAAMGVNLSPLVRPSQVLADDPKQITLSGWNWVADIQGAYLGADLNRSHVSVLAVNFGEFEARNDIPTEDPISTFGYSLFSVGGAYAIEMNQFTLGLGAELIYERTLNASSTGMALSLAASYPVNSDLEISSGVRRLGNGGELDSAQTELPSELWAAVDFTLNDLTILTELNTGSYPLAVGVSYRIADIIEVLGGMQIELAEPSMRIHPSLGLSVSRENFTVAYTNYQMSHRLGSRHFLSLYWRY